MKVLHLGKFDSFGGIERHVQALLRGLVARGGVDVVNLVSGSDPVTDEHHEYAYPTVRAASHGVIASVAISPSLPRLARQLHRKYRFDIVHLHFPDPLGLLAASLLPRDVARVVSWHSDIVRQRLALAFYGPLARRFLRASDAIIGATPLHFSASTQIPRDIDDTRRFVVPYGFEPSHWSMTAAATNRLQNLLREKDGRFAVFALGRHVYYKGFDVLIEAMRDVDGVLWLGGTGPLTARLSRQARAAGIADRVKFVGNVPHAELPAYYEACDVFCLPSTERSEAFGLVQLEAMYFRRPVIATALGTGVEWVNQTGITGLLVPPNDAPALSQALRQLSSNALMRTNMGTAGHQRVLEHFSSDRMVDLILAVYQCVLQKRQSNGFRPGRFASMRTDESPRSTRP